MSTPSRSHWSQRFTIRIPTRSYTAVAPVGFCASTLTSTRRMSAIREHGERATEEGRSDPAPPMGRRDREVVDPAAVFRGARGEHADRYPSVPRQQPHRGVVVRAARFLLDPPIERRGVVTPVVDERLVQQPVDRREILVRLDPTDIDPLRRPAGLQRFDQVDLHVPEVMDGSKAPGAEHRRGGIVCRVDRVLEPERRGRGRQLAALAPRSGPAARCRCPAPGARDGRLPRTARRPALRA